MLIVTLVGAWIEVWIVGIIWGGFVEVNKGEWGTDSIGLDKGFVAWYLWAKKIFLIIMYCLSSCRHPHDNHLGH